MSREHPPAEKFGRFRLLLSVQAPEEAAPSREDARDDQLVESGSFRVDTAWMIEKLRKHQIGDPLDFLAPLLRAAVASGATRVSLDRATGGFAMRFDGRPFSSRELADPLRALADREGEAAARGVHLAYGLLALERLGPELVQITSGGPSGQATAVLTTKKSAPPGWIGINRAEGTVLGVRWGWSSSWGLTKDVFRRAAKRYGMTSTALLVEGRPVPGPPPPGEKNWHRFETEGWRGAFRFVEDESPLSRVRLYCLGAFVEEVRERVGFQPVEALLGSDALNLDLSQSGVVRDWKSSVSGSSLEEGLALLRDQAERYFA
ncbi:MAG TPA: hypothetical protein DCM05_16140 [Elusimicrobia bacterium]|nr:hypothetical protein [Elusimicrobiota bacterium]